MTGPVAAILPDGRRLHLNHGPIDLVVGVDGPARDIAFAAATARFETILQELADELPSLRRAPGQKPPQGSVPRRMYRAVVPHAAATFVTPMAAVAGAVADEVLAAMHTATPMTRAYVNNGGDIALHLDAGQSFRMAMAGLDGTDHGRIEVKADAPVRGLATSGRGGRSMTMGVADAVTVLARTSAQADVAATLIANAVDLPNYPAITRQPACVIDPNSDLGDRLVVKNCPQLARSDVETALARGQEVAARMESDGLIAGAALFLQGASRLLAFPAIGATQKVTEHA